MEAVARWAVTALAFAVLGTLGWIVGVRITPVAALVVALLVLVVLAAVLWRRHLEGRELEQEQRRRADKAEPFGGPPADSSQQY